MRSVLTHGTRKRPGSFRSAFVFALLCTLGVAFAALQAIQPVREAYGLDSLVRPVTGMSLVELLPEAVDTPETMLFDRLASAQRIERSLQPVPTRRLGSGTRRAVRLASAEVQPSSTGSESHPAVTVQPVVATVSSPSQTIQRLDSARRDDVEMGPVQYAKLDDALRRLVDSGPAAPIRVAVVNSGVTLSRDLSADRIAAFFDFTQRDDDQAVQLTATVDASGYVTHVAGPIGGSGDTSAGGCHGPDWKVTFVGFKVLDEDGAGYTSDVLAAIEHVVQHNEVLGIDVLNLSLGHPIFEPAATDPLVQAVEAAVASCIVVVASAGNMGINRNTGEVGSAGVTSPGNAPAAIPVGSLDLNGNSTAMLGWGDLAGAELYEGGN